MASSLFSSTLMQAMWNGRNLRKVIPAEVEARRHFVLGVREILDLRLNPP
ncbi:hypothetical protein [Allocoleopsis sp.]